MVKARKEQLNVLRAYWTKIIYTATGDTTSTTISEAALNAVSITKTSGGNASSTPPIRGVVTAGSNNYVRVRDANTALPFSVSGAVIYGRLTYSGGNYSVTYYTRVNSVETATNIPGSGSLSVQMLFPEVMQANEVPVSAVIADEAGFAGGGGSSDMSHLSIQLHDTTYSPVGLWQFQGDLLDTSGNGFNMSALLSGVSTTPIYEPISPGVLGITNKSGSYKVLRDATDSALRLTDDITIEFFCKFTGPIGGTLLVHGLEAENSTDNYLYKIEVVGTRQLEWTQESGSGNNSGFTIRANIDSGRLYHIAITRKSQVIRAYVNGERSGLTSGALTTPNGGTSGKLHILSDSSGTSTDAAIASLKIIPFALTAAQVRAEYDRTFGPLFGQVLAQTNNFSLQFDGVDDYVRFGTNFSKERTDSFTLSIWAKWSSTSSFSVISKLTNSAPIRGYDLFFNGGSVGMSLQNTGGSNYISVSTTDTTLADGTWKHIVATYNGSSLASGVKIYVNGSNKPLTIGADTLSSTITNSVIFAVGCRPDSSVAFPYNGYAREVAIYNKELSASEVLAIYNDGEPVDLSVTGPINNLEGYWHMGIDVTFSDVPDSSEGGHDGVMTNMALTSIVAD